MIFLIIPPSPFILIHNIISNQPAYSKQKRACVDIPQALLLRFRAVLIQCISAHFQIVIHWLILNFSRCSVSVEFFIQLFDLHTQLFAEFLQSITQIVNGIIDLCGHFNCHSLFTE